jgi:hypothetical protein
MEGPGESCPESAAVGAWFPRTHTLVYATAGEHPPLILHDGKVRNLGEAAGGLPLGVTVGEHYAEQRCHETESRQGDHQFGPWAYAAPDSCQQLRRCQRCAEQQTQQAGHVWDVWVFEGPTSCNQLHFCRRCAARELRAATEIEHDWGDWAPVDGDPPTQEQRACLRCHIQETRAAASNQMGS